MFSTALNSSKILVGSSINALNFAKVYGKICLKELFLLNLINRLIDEHGLTKKKDELAKLETLASIIQNKTFYICKVKNRNIEDYRNILSFNLQLTANLNVAPVITNSAVSYTTNFYQFTSADFTSTFIDAEGGVVDTIRIVSIPANGELMYGSQVVSAGFEFSILGVNNLTYTRTSGVSTTDSFTYKASDNDINKIFSNMATMNITINTPTNSPPTQVGSNTFNLSSSEIYTFTAADFTTGTTPPYLDPEGDDPDVIKVTLLPVKGVLKVSNVPVALNGSITYTDILQGIVTYEANYNGGNLYQDTFTFSIKDTGSLAYTAGGNFTINVAAFVNQPATIGSGSMTVAEGAVTTFTRADFTSNTTPPYFDPDGDPALNLKITVLATTGTLKLNGVAVALNQIIPFTDIDSNLLTYTQASNAGGTAPNFQYEIQDAGSGIYTA